MPILFDYDPETGIKEFYDYDPIKDQVMITTEQDVGLFVDRMNALRKNEDYSKAGMKEEWWHYCSIPTVVELELRKKGLHLENKDHIKAILREINANYPFLKATTKKHA
jgi:hypothetical protein